MREPSRLKLTCNNISQAHCLSLSADYHLQQRLGAVTVTSLRMLWYCCSDGEHAGQSTISIKHQPDTHTHSDVSVTNTQTHNHRSASYSRHLLSLHDPVPCSHVRQTKTFHLLLDTVLNLRSIFMSRVSRPNIIEQLPTHCQCMRDVNRPL